MPIRFEAVSEAFPFPLSICVAILCVLMVPLSGLSQTVSLAGSNAPDTTIFSSVSTPLGVAVDVNGAIYVADSGNKRVIQLTSTSTGYQIQTTIANISNSGSGFSPTGVAVDSALNVYVVDRGSGKLLQFPWNGTGFTAPVTVLSGLSTLVGANVVVDATGDAFVSDWGNHRIVEVPWTGTAYGATVTISSYGSGGSQAIAVDGNLNVYFADPTITQILKASWTGTAYSAPVAVVTGLSGLRGIATDSGGNLYFTVFAGVFSALSNGSGYGTPFAIGTNASFGQPSDLAIGTLGTVFVTDSVSNTVSTILPPGDFGALNVGSTSASRTLTFVFQTAGTLGSHAVISPTEPSSSTLVYPGDFEENGVATAPCQPGSYSAGAKCSVSVTFLAHHAGTVSGAVVLYASNGSPLISILLTGYGVGPEIVFNPQQTNFPAALSQAIDGPFAFDQSGNMFFSGYTASTGASTVEEAVWNGTSFNPPITLMSGPEAIGIGVDAAGNVYVGDYLTTTIFKIPRTQTSSSTGFGTPVTVWVGSQPTVTTWKDCAKQIQIAPKLSGNQLGMINDPFDCITVTSLSGTWSSLLQMAVDGAGNIYFESTTTAVGMLKENGDLGVTLTKLPVTSTGYKTPQIISPPHLETLFSPTQGSLPMAVDASGNLFLNVVDSSGFAAVYELPSTNGGYSLYISQVLSGLEPDGFGNAIAVDSNENVYATSGTYAGGFLMRASFTGTSWVPATVASFPIDDFFVMALDASGNPWVVTFPFETGTPHTLSELNITSFPPVTFPTPTFVGETDTADGPMTVTLLNIGNQPLALNPVYPASFPVNTSDSSLCAAGNTLSITQTCDLSMTFAPVSAGYLQNAVTSSGTLNSTASPAIAVSGTGKAQVGLAFGTAPAAALEAGGNAGSAVTVVAEDLGTVETGATPTVTLQVTGPAGYAQTYTTTASAGVATFNLSGVPLTALGTYYYQASAQNFSSASAYETVVPAATAYLVFGTPPVSEILAGENAGSAITVEEEDGAGLVRPSAADTITLTVTGPAGYSATYSVKASAGVATFNLSTVPLTAIGNYTYTATSGSIAAATATETVNAGALNFGTVNVGTTTGAQVATIVFPAAASGFDGSIDVVTQGAINKDFTLAAGGNCAFSNYSLTSYSAGQTCTVKVVFSPKEPGLRIGAVDLFDFVGNLVGQQFVYGIGAAPRAAFNGQNTTGVYGANFAYVIGLAVDGGGNVYAADRTNNDVVEMKWNGSTYNAPMMLGDERTFTYDGQTIGPGQLWAFPGQVAVDGAGNVYVAEGGESAFGGAPPRVVKMPVLPGSNGTLCCGADQLLGGGWGNPQGIAVDRLGNVFVADNCCVSELPWTGIGYGSKVQIANQFSLARQLAIDTEGNLFVVSLGQGLYELPLTSGGYGSPVQIGNYNAVGVAIDGVRNLYVEDNNSGNVFMLPWTGSAYGAGVVVASPGKIEVGYVNGVAVDSVGDVYVGNRGDYTVYKYDTVNPGSLQFNTATDEGFSDTADGPQTLTLYNTGNEDLAFTEPQSGSNPSYPVSFPENSTDASLCTSSSPVAPGLSCDVSANFTPQTAGSFSANITLTDNSVNGSTQTVGVNGTAVPQPVATQLAFGTSPPPALWSGGNAGSGITVIEQTSTAVQNYQATDTITLTVTGPAGYSQTYTATAVAGLATFNLSNTAITIPGGYTYTATFTGLTSATANETVTSQNVGVASAPETVTVVIGLGGMLTSIQALTGGAPNLDYSVTNGGTCALGTVYSSAQSCTVNVIFTPRFAGTRSGAVLLMDSNANVLGTSYIGAIAQGPQIAFTPGRQIPLGTGLNAPSDVAVDGNGNVYIADQQNSRIVKVPWTGTGYGPEVTLVSYQFARGVAVDGAGNVYVTNLGGETVVKFPWNGGSFGTPITIGSGFQFTFALAADAAGNVYVVDNNLSTPFVWKIPWNGSGYGPQVKLGSGWQTPSGVAVDAAGNVYVADEVNTFVTELPWNGSGYGAAVQVGSGLSSPRWPAVDGIGNLYISDAGNGRVVMEPYTTGGFGTQTTVLGGLATPQGLSVDGAGNLYIAETSAGSVIKLDVSDAPNISFPTPTVDGTTDTTDGPQTVTILNIGNQGLVFGGRNGPSYPANFPENANDHSVCASGSMIFPGQSCDVSINFAPTTGGANTGSVVLTDNALNVSGATQAIGVNGTGQLPAAATLSATSIAFGNVLQNTSSGTQSVTLTNTGGVPLSITSISVTGPNASSFSFSNSCGTSLAVGANCTIQGYFAPTAEGPMTASITLTDNAANSPQSIALSGTGTGPTDTLSTTSINFGSLPLGHTSTLPVTITSTGAAANLTVSAIRVTGVNPAAFTTTNNCTGAPIAPPSTCTIQVTFTPGLVGTFTAFLSITDTAYATPQLVALSGTATGAEVAYYPAPQTTVGSGWGFPAGTAVDAQGNLYVADLRTSYVVELPVGGGSSIKIGTGLNQADGVAVDGIGNVYISDAGNRRVVEVPAGGGAQIVLASGLSYPAGIGVDGNGNVYYADPFAPGIFKIPAGGGTPVAVGSGWSSPFGLAVDALGNVFYSDSAGNTVVELPAGGGSPVTIIPAIGILNDPSGVAVDAAGNLYVSDTIHNRVIEVLANGGGQITIASTGLKYPYLPSVDSAGNVYIPDSSNARVVKVMTAQAPSLSFASTNIGSTSSDSPQIVTVYNPGNASLVFSGISAPASFAQVAGGGSPPDCHATSTVAAGGSCELAFSFTPQSPGNLGGSVTMTDNALNVANATQSISLSGTGLSSPAILLSPTPGISTKLGTTNVSFQWTTGAGVTQYQLSLGTTAPGASDLYLYKGTATSIVVPTLPANGVTVYATLSSKINGAWQANAYLYTESGTATPAVLTSPTPGLGTVLGTSNVAFQWTGTGATLYQLNLSVVAPGNSELFAYKGTATSASVPTVPAVGMTVYARLYSFINAAWQYNDYTYTESGTHAAQLTSPAPGLGTILGASNVTFQWTTGAGVADYQLNLSAIGAGQSELFVYKGTATSAIVTTLPANGATVYATLYSKIGGAWQSNAYQYTESGTPIPSTLTSPTPGLTTILGTSNVAFQWTVGGASTYQLNLSATTPGASDLFLYKGTGSSAIVPTLPANGVTVYATLYSKIKGTWQSNSYVYTESGTPTPAALTSPAPGLGTILGTTNVMFQWSKGTSASNYQLNLSTVAPGNSDLFLYKGTALSASAPTLPANGVKVYARLYSKIDGVWLYNDYVYTEQ